MYTETQMNLVAKVLTDPTIDVPSLIAWLAEDDNVYPGWWFDFRNQPKETKD